MFHCVAKMYIVKYKKFKVNWVDSKDITFDSFFCIKGMLLYIYLGVNTTINIFFDSFDGIMSTPD